VLEAHRVGTHGGPSTLAAYARHPDVSEQVWSAEVGYPGDGRYLEFHRRKDGDGLRYWRVTSRQTDLGDKLTYDPGLVAEVAHSQALHFCSVVHERLAAWQQLTGRPGVVVAAFDAELFGHWWHEGPEFLAQLFINLARDPRVVVQTAAERTASHPPDKVVWLPEGSWGAGGDHRVWLNERTSWTWEAAWRAEDRYLGLLWRLRQSRSTRARKVLQAAGRELLLLQASDWQFVVETGGAVDYGFRRFCLHLDRFDTLCNAAHDLLEGRSLNALQRLREQEAGASDPCFAELDLAAWESP
jgi:1,4-alpha-glucan branching enzyme